MPPPRTPKHQSPLPIPTQTTSDDDTPLMNHTMTPEEQRTISHLLGEQNRLLRTVINQQEELSDKVSGIEQKLAVNDERSVSEGEERKENREMRKEMIVLRTRFAIVWAGLAVAAATGITSLVTTIFVLVKAAP